VWPRPARADEAWAPVDLVAVAVCVVLDALGCDGVRVDALVANQPARRWALDTDAVTSTALDDLLARGARGADSNAPLAVVQWIDGEHEAGVSALDAAIAVTAHADDEGVRLSADGEVLDGDVAPDVFADLVGHVVEQLAADPRRPAAQVPLVSAEQQHWLVDALNDVRVAYPEAETVDELVQAVAARTPVAVAIDDGTVPVTYAQLLERAHTVADTLRAAECRPGEAVAVMFARGVDCVASMLGVLLAGGVYVPIATAEPTARRERLLDLLSVRLLLLQSDHSRGVGLEVRDAEGLVLRGDDPDDRGSSPLYVMFTSGSTGDPKAVVASHRSVIRLVRDPWFVDFRAGDGVGFASNPGFDAATWEVWGALVNGARLVVLDADVVTKTEALEGEIAEREVSVLFLTTSLFNAHARVAPAMFGPLRIMSIGGEAADPRACQRVLTSSSPPEALLNAYGPTESTTFASWHPITDVPEGALRLPIGTPIANTTLHVLDRRGRVLPPGVPGELHIGGDGLALGYFGDPDLTARKFVPDPFAGPPHRLYATGDLVVRAESGEVVFVRRIDDQLKIRGHRVEPLEVAAAIESLDGVSAAVVLPRVAEGYTRLVAYVVIESPGLDAASIRAQLAVDLPAYLVPSRVVVVDDLPLTKSGKLDRARLPDPFAPPRDGGTPNTDADPRPDAERRLTETLTEIWSQVLGVHDVDPDQTFFDAGGDSLLAVRLYGAVQRRFGVVLPSGTIDQHFTVAKFDAAVRAALERAAPPLVTEMTTVDGPLVVLAAPGGGEVDDYRWLAAALDDAYHVVGLREPGHYGTEPRPRTLAELSATCRWALENAGFDAPVAIVGYCAGGVLAHQMACDLAAAGHRVDLVVLLDTPIPGARDAHDHDRSEPLGKLAQTVRRRSWNAVALARMQTRRTYYRLRQQPMPRPLAHRMTLRSNFHRLRKVSPSFFEGHLLFVQAADGDDPELEAAPGYWRTQSRSFALETMRGAHDGPESFLSRSNAATTAAAIARELDPVRRSRIG
jgi:amino acid adenylation domain-containing protein